MMKSKLPNSVLRRVWNLSDIDQDGMLDRDEFAVSMFLIDHKLSGNDIPDVLPDRLIPPSKVKRYGLSVREDERRRPSDGGNSTTSHEASYSRDDSGYGRDANYRGTGGVGMSDPSGGEGGAGCGREGGYEEDTSYGGNGGGNGGGQEREDTSYGGRHSSASRGRHDDHDDDSNHLASFIDRGQ